MHEENDGYEGKIKLWYKESACWTLNNSIMSTSKDNSVKNKPQSIIVVSNLDASNIDDACDEASQKHNTSKNIDTIFKEVDKSENEDGFDLFSSDENMDSLRSKESESDGEIMPQEKEMNKILED